MKKVTEKIIAKAGLSKQEKKVARVHFDLPAAGQRTKKWVEALSNKKSEQLLFSAQEKIQQILKDQKAKRARN